MRHVFLALLVLSVIAAFFLGYASNVSIRSIAVSPTPMPSIIASPSASVVPQTIVVKMKLPAVDKEGRGALADLVVEARQGKGRVFIGFEDSPLINADTQSSLRVALDVARRFAQTDTKNVDVSYTFSTQSDVVGGKSAGAAAAIATIAALRKETLRPDALITGTVEPDGSIGQVGKIFEKAKAAKEAGFKTILVPRGESTQNVVVEECKEKRTARTFVKECFSTVQKIDVSKEVGIAVIEVEDIPAAYEYFK